MSWDRGQLAALAAVVDNGTFDAAARALSITPSAVSQRIRALETRLGQVAVTAGMLRLYKAFEFPVRWSLVAILLRGYFASPSIVRHEGKWWLFAGSDLEGKGDTLRLYWSNELLGPWVEHPSSPIVKGNSHIARPAGRVVPYEGHLVRFTQDCFLGHETAVRAFFIPEMTSTTYHELACSHEPLLHASGKGWNQSGMHHVDAHCMEDGQWLACVDGFRLVSATLTDEHA
jgi:hypothetical protein